MEYLNEQQRIDLITKLSEDDSFRERLFADPKAILEEYYGIELLPEDDPGGGLSNRLPSKEEFRENFDDHVAQANASIACQRIYWFVRDEAS